MRSGAPFGPEWVISGCAGPSAARQVNLKKRTPELDRAELKLRNLLAGWQQCSACEATVSDPLRGEQPTADRAVSAE